MRKTGVVATTMPIRITRIKSGLAKRQQTDPEKLVAIDRDPPRVSPLGHRLGLLLRFDTTTCSTIRLVPSSAESGPRVMGGYY